MAKTKDPRKMTFEESGATLKPYVSLPVKNNEKCKNHDYKPHSDNLGHNWIQCSKCGIAK